MRLSLLLLAGLLLAAPGSACGATEAEPEWVPSLSTPRQMVPSSALPTGLALMEANNNLDIARFDGRLYLAWRNAPSHFAAPETRMLVASTTDEVAFEVEATFAEGTDLREPRFLEVDGTLFLYVAVLGDNPLDFEPQGMMVSQRRPDGTWTALEWFHDPGFIPWRTKMVDGRPAMLTYVGGENVYDINGDGLEVHWLTTTDGLSWRAFVEGQPVVSTGGGSEADVVVMDDGAVVAVIRNEAGDELGFGSKLCRAPPEAPGQWSCVADPRKFDSPLLFRHGADVWLIARRNLTADGLYQLSEEVPPEDRYFTYQLAYWQTPKRCSLWRVDPETLAVEHTLDLASRGDTCFAGMVADGPHRFILYNYSSPLEGPDLSWIEGQQGPTHIYRQVLSFEPAL